ncbi:helix-turn-helix domain-containing protein [Cytobacillus spongiae]|jgi:transcriptional regulator with XRE-family HTH domain|uniref:helix-turn-helix domain-containing protein n=1 Tax=Cytobacillus spongiae TaxID=2901381 RepID=UPI001F3ACE77|nr:helix-turn-helix domain-containing protein [Cytobacillus spongiae]UII55354.1 helix-turn-helix domain-containing protein [Cytobacillus spongiae]
MSTIAQNIKACRERVGMTQQELALKIRVGTGTIEKYESGEQHPDTQTVLKISTVLDIPASELLEQDLQTNHVGIDHEIEQLVQEIGTKKAKLILRKAKEFTEEDFLRVMQMLFEIKYKK